MASANNGTFASSCYGWRGRNILFAAIALTACSTREAPRDQRPVDVSTCTQSVAKAADETWLDSGPFPRSAFRTAAGCPDCLVMNIAPLALPHSGVAAASAKIRRPDGRYEILTLDTLGKAADAKTLIAAERAARTVAYGKLSPALASWLASAAPTETKWVAIWTNVAPRFVPRTELRDDAARKEHLATLDSDVAAQAGPIKTWLAANAPTAEFGDSSGPMFHVRLTPGVIRNLAKLPYAADISMDGYPGKAASFPWSTYSQWGSTIQLANSHLFAAGEYARVCVKEQYRHDDPYNKLEITATAYPSGTTHWHARLSAGIIRNKDVTAAPYRSMAPLASVYMANWTGYTGTGGVDQWCRDRYTTTLNYGHFLGTAPGGLTATDRAHDWLAKTSPYILVVGTAGYVDYTWDTVGNRGYNGLVVGGVDDRNTADPSDDLVDTSVAWRNPTIYYNDYELPHVVAPSNGVAVAGSEFGGGASAATAMVSGVSSVIDGTNSTLRSWPEGKRAVIIATATGVTNEGILTKLPSPGGDRKTGVGVVNAANAVLASQTQFWASPSSTSEIGHYADTVYFDSSHFESNDYMINKWKTKASKSGRLRVALAWDATATCSGAGGLCTSDVPDVDLDLHLFKKTGDSSWTTTIIPECYSTSYESTWEVCDIAVDADDEYMIAVRKYGANASWTYLGVAWFHYQQPSGAMCTTNAECASGTCASGKCTCASDTDCPERYCSSGGQCVDRTPCGGVGQTCCSSTTVAQPQCNPGAQCVSGTCSTCSGCPAEPIRIYPTKTTFKQSESVAFRVFLPNNGTSSCLLTGDSLGVLTIESLTLNGTAVTPTVTTAAFIDGFFSARDKSLISTLGNTWRTLSWKSERYPWMTPANALVSTTTSGFSGGDVARYNVGAIGNYVARVRYNHGPSTPAGLCSISSQIATVNFTVVGS